ncbi:MAG: DUF3008 family protein [Rhodanobacter sp.]
MPSASLCRPPCEAADLLPRLALPAKPKLPSQPAVTALAAKRVDTKLSTFKGASKSSYESITEDVGEAFAAAPRNGSPGHGGPH